MIVTILLIVIILALIGADQAVKYWAVTSLQPKGSIDFINIGKLDVLDLTYVQNDGAIFGSMSGQRWFLIGFTSLVIIAGIYVLFKYQKRSKVLTTALVLFIAGGIGNLVDRIRLGYVVDLFEVKLFKFAVFNVADICVVFAIIFLFIYVLFVEPKIEKINKLNSDSEKAKDNG